MDDAALLEAFVKEQSDEAFKEIVRRHIGVVYSVCRRQLRDEHWAEDVTQAVFILLARKAPTIPRQVVLGGWLYKAAFFACSNARDLRRTRSFHESRVLQMRIPHEQSPVGPGEREELEGLLDQGLMCLTKTQREVLVLRFFENMSLVEVARSRRQSLYSTQKAFDAGLAGLRRFLAERGVTVGLVAVTAILFEQSAKAIPEGLATTVGAAALHASTSQIPAHIAQLVATLARRGLRTKALAGLSTTIACLLLSLAGLMVSGHLPSLGWRAAPQQVAALTAAEEAREIGALWQTLRQTELALRHMDAPELARRLTFSDAGQMRQWDAMVRVFEADLRLRETVAARFGADAPALTAIQTFGQRLDAVLPAVDPASCRWTVGPQSAALHFAYREGTTLGGSLYFVKQNGEWRIDASRSIELALEGLNNAGNRDAVALLGDADQARVWDKMDRLAQRLDSIRDDIDSRRIARLDDARMALQASAPPDADSRAFFHLALRFDDQEAFRN